MKIILALMLFFFSCKEVELSTNAVKDPKIESPASIHLFLTSNKCANEKSAAMRFSALSSMVRYEISPTSVYVFDKKGNNLKLPGATNKCAPEPSLFIQRLSASRQYEQAADAFNLNNIKDWIQVYDRKGWKIDDKADYFVFVTWAIWPGKKVFNRDIMSCISAARNNRNAKIDIVLINLDLQSEWGEENLKKVKFTKNSMAILY